MLQIELRWPATAPCLYLIVLDLLLREYGFNSDFALLLVMSRAPGIKEDDVPPSIIIV